jgi:hypothetical protein
LQEEDGHVRERRSAMRSQPNPLFPPFSAEPLKIW